jgi:hypothetical protein
VGVRAGAALLAVLAGSAAHAQPAPEVDWERGLVIASAVGTADRRAPSPAVARVGSRRQAEERATAALRAAAATLPVAGGAAVPPPDGPWIELDTEHLPDGSVRVRRGLPLEAIRQAIAGPRPVAPAWDGAGAAGGPTAVVVDARNLRLTPRVGIAVTDGTRTASLPAIWVRRAPKESDARLGGRAHRVKASALDAAGALVVAGVPLDEAAAAGALLVVVIREGT